MKDFKSALQSLQRALEIRLELIGEKHSEVQLLMVTID